MSRIVVRDADGTVAGWFDPATATVYEDGTRWDGEQLVGLNCGSRNRRQTLLRTSGGRWVIETTSKYIGEDDRYRFVSDDEAQQWLIVANEYDDVLAELFPETPAEVGPGRPEVGPAVKLRMPRELVERLDARAQAEGVTRSELIRRAVETLLA